MCGRINEKLDPFREYEKRLTWDKPRTNIAPTEDVALIHDGVIEPARWWLVPSWAKEISSKYSMFNARSEKLTQSPAFRGPFKSQRGILALDSFLEWRGPKGDKQPWSVTNEDGLLYAAALWDVWHGGGTPLLSCTIVTTAAAPEFEPWHNRMPVLLADNEIDQWLDNEHEIPADDPLFRPELKFTWLVAPVAKAAGNSRNKDPKVMEPIGEVVTLST